MHLYLFFSFLLLPSLAYLYPPQLTLIRSIMSNPETPPLIRVKTQRVLIRHHLGYAIALSQQFRRNLKSKKYITNHARDLQQYAIHGLVVAVRRYDGRINLLPFARKYIMGYMYYGITELSPLRSLTHYERYTKKIKIPPTYLSSDLWFYDKSSNCFDNKNNENNADKVYDKIRQMTMEQKMILGYRYDLITFQVKRSWIEVAQLMGCSVETIRKRLLPLHTKV